jgi:hypothetical protein
MQMVALNHATALVIELYFQVVNSGNNDYLKTIET